MNQEKSKNSSTGFLKEGSNYVIRSARRDEKKEVRSLMWRCFPITEAWPFRFTPHVLVVIYNDQIVGATALRISSLSKKCKTGFVEYIFTAPEVRGMGFGQKLVETSLEYFEEHGCNEIITQIKGDNTSSSKSFSTRGFTILSPGQQLRRYGIKVIPLWLKTMHILAKGQFLWVKTEIEKPDKPKIQWWGNFFTNLLVLLVIGLIPDTGIPFDFFTLIGVFTICIFFFGTRQLSMMLVAKINGLAVRYRPIEDWFAMSFIFALSGIWIPVPGNVYPKKDTWSYRDEINKLGPIAIAGVFVVLLISWMIFILSLIFSIPPEFAIWLGYAIKMGCTLSFLDVVFPFFPFEYYNGRRIWDWNKYVWAIFAGFAVTLFIFAFFF